MRSFYFNLPVSVKPSALPRTIWTARTSMRLTLPLTGVRTATAKDDLIKQKFMESALKGALSQVTE